MTLATTLNPAPAALERLAYTVTEAAKVSTISRTRLYGLMAEGRLRSSTIGTRRVILADDLRALLAAGA